MSDTSGEPLEETQGFDAVLAEGMRRLGANDSSGWRRLVRENPGRADELQAHAARLQRFGFFTGSAAPSKVGRYRLIERLGHGGMGVVYRARAEGADVDRAVKLVRPERIDGELGRQRFRREVAASSSLQHPGIVRVLDVGIDDEVPWFAMELVAGSSLADLIAVARRDGDDSVPERAVARITRGEVKGGLRPWLRFVLDTVAQVLDALQHAHEHGVLHRDVKPSNVLVEPTGRAVLIDFGLAHVDAATTITRSSDTLGSLPYMAPELLRASSEASVATDVYATGAMLYHAIGLQLPFVGANNEGLRHGILHTAPRPLRDLEPSLPAVIADVCAKAMSPEPQRRYASAAAFAADLRAVLAGERPRARPAGPVLRLRRWLRRHPLRALALVTAFAFAGVLPTGLYLVQANELRKTTRLSDLHRVGELRAAEKQLWPARPDVVTRPEGMDAWLAQVDELLGRRGVHATDLAAVRARGRPMTAAERSADPSWHRVQSEIDELRNNMHDAVTNRTAGWEDWLTELQEVEAPLVRRLDVAEGMVFADPADARLFGYLADLVLGLEQLDALQQKVLARRVRAEELRAASLDAAAAEWKHTLAAIADVGRNPRYRGLRMEPQFGLVPLGQDPESGFFEFAHVASGRVPTRGPDGRFTIGEDDGIVLVLLPGGRVRVGADLDPCGPNYDPKADPGDTPSVEVRLDPFFLGKFEVTQGQWVRQRGHNNCMIKPGDRVLTPDRPVTAAHPVDAVTWLDALRIVTQWGLQLPTGAQWEYGARGGTTGGIWCGDGPESLDGAANLFDQDLLTTPWYNGGDYGYIQPADGWPVHAPVGRYRANQFGLHDVFGNVCEMTLDARRPYAAGLQDGDGRTGNVDSGTQRGGAFNMPARECRVSRRLGVVPDTVGGGIRVARRIEGVWTLKE